MKKIAGFALVLASLLAMACATTAPAEFKGPAPLAQEVKITLMHTNDMHARIAESKTEVGYARMAAAFNEKKAANPNTVLIDAGDVFHGLPVANIERGTPIVKLMNEMGYSYMTTGNHDYNYTFDGLLELQKLAKFKILAANVYKDGKRVFTPYVIQELQGVRVAFLGLASPETAYKADPKGLTGVTFADPVVEARTIANEIAGQYDVLVVISHLGTDASSDPTSISIAKAVPETDVIIDGHSHTTLADLQKLNQTPVLIASTGGYGVGLGVVDLVVGTDRAVKSKAASTITVANSPNLKGDPKIAAMITDLTKAQDAVLSQVIGKTEVALEGKRELVRTSQTNLGTLIANGILDISGADIALMNGGGIRDSIPVGNITMKQVYTVLPFGNYIQTGKLKGSELKAVLENGVGKMPAPDGRFPHLAGWSYTADLTRPAGDRITAVFVNGKPVDPNKEYLFATINFQWNGGDDYRMLVGKAQNDFPSDAEVFLAYLKKIGTVTPDKLVQKK
jgi:2',3'-cyclic-nucleotide 2'-phosphodiesterase (5'-nucleotidase family)